MRSVRERALVMHFPVHTPEAKGEKSIAARASRILFFLYLFFVLLGTSNPYRDRVAHAEDIITSNPVNQVVYSVLPFLSLLCLPPKGKKLMVLLKKEKYLTLFLLWCLLSVLWSPRRL